MTFKELAENDPKFKAMIDKVRLQLEIKGKEQQDSGNISEALKLGRVVNIDVNGESDPLDESLS